MPQCAEISIASPKQDDNDEDDEILKALTSI